MVYWAHMKTQIFTLLFLLSGVGHTLACDTQNVRMVRSTGFGLSLGSGGFSRKVNIPLTYEGKRGCWEQESQLGYEVKSKKGKFSGEVLIYPPQSDFKNVPGRTETYLLIDHSKLDKAAPLRSTSLDLVSFTCAGESVLSIEAFSGSFSDVDDLTKVDMSFNSVFATGEVARRIAERRRIAKRESGQLAHIPHIFANIFVDRYGQDEFANLEHKVSLPSVYMSSSLRTNMVETSESFVTNKASHYGCSTQFKETMKEFHLSNLKTKLKKAPFKVKIRKKKISLKWK